LYKDSTLERLNMLVLFTNLFNSNNNFFVIEKRVIMTGRIFSKLNLVLFTFVLAVVFTGISQAKVTLELPQWQQHKIPGEPSLRGSAIIDNSMWVTGSNNSVFVSQDGGKSWQDKSVKASVKTGFRDIELFDKNTAIVMGIGEGESSMLYKTVDGGNSWHLLYQNMDKKGFFDSIAFWDRDNGLLMGDPVDGYYVIKKTTDGGRSWRRIAQEKLPKMLEKEAAFAASGNTMIVGENGKAYLTTGGFSSSVYVSDDYGESWQRQSVPLYQTTQYAGGYGLALNHLQQLFVVGGDFEQRNATYSNIATLIDGVWQKVAAGEKGLRSAMSCQAKICISTGKTSSDISLDHGHSWQTLHNNNAALGDKGFYTLAADGFIFLAAGAEGKVGILSFKR